tara:strand:+ start:133 stop:384 length:252 start_codon:yes stop_codon:yes gene_type:complete
MAKPSIEQIEREISRARFTESETEGFLRTRAKYKARRQALRQYSDEGRRLAYMAGYRAASNRTEAIICATVFYGILVLLVLAQ